MYSPILNWSKRKNKKTSDGYVLIYVPTHPKSFRGWYYEHRLMMEKKYNRILEDWETVHHINGNKADNREINLFVCGKDQHSKAHRLPNTA
jgi:hypothetical protein